MTKISRVLKHLVMLAVCALFFFIGAITAQSATYYVATTGNDSNPGTSDRPWRNPQQCVDNDSPLVAGDTCLVRAGNYTSTTTGRVVVIGPSSPAGEAGSPITIKAETPRSVLITVPNFVSGWEIYRGFTVARPYYVIEGFEIIRPGSYFGATSSAHAIDFEGTATGGVARYNYIHDLGRNVCSNSDYAVDGFSVTASNVTIEHNVLHTIGRLRNGEKGCSTAEYQNDHGIYAKATANLTIRRNVFYDINRGYPIHIFQSGGGVTTNLKIHHNVFADKSPTEVPRGQIILGNTLNGVEIKNNIFYDPPLGYGINYFAPVMFNVVVSYNLSNSTASSILNPVGKPTIGITESNNILNTNPGFKNAGSRDYTLTSSSTAINRGTTVGVPPVTDGDPDIGAYEFSEQDGGAAPLAPRGLSIQ